MRTESYLRPRVFLIGLGAAALAVSPLAARPAAAQTILFINGTGTSTAGPVLTGGGFTVIADGFRPGAISDHLNVPNTISQIWVWNDGTYGNSGSPYNPAVAFSAADESALVAFNAAHPYWIMDDLAWRSHGSPDEINFTRNEALNLEGAGGGIVLGTDDGSGDALLQHVNQVAGLFGFNLFAGAYLTSPATHHTGGTFFTSPNPVNPAGVVGTTTYAETPNGLQPNGIFLGTAVFGQGAPIPPYSTQPLGDDTFNGVTYSNVNHLVTTNIPGAAINAPGVPEPGPLAALAGLISSGGLLLFRRRKAARAGRVSVE